MSLRASQMFRKASLRRYLMDPLSGLAPHARDLRSLRLRHRLKVPVQRRALIVG
jgi:hypothetical protein